MSSCLAARLLLLGDDHLDREQPTPVSLHAIPPAAPASPVCPLSGTAPRRACVVQRQSFRAKKHIQHWTLTSDMPIQLSPGTVCEPVTTHTICSARRSRNSGAWANAGRCAPSPKSRKPSNMSSVQVARCWRGPHDEWTRVACSAHRRADVSWKHQKHACDKILRKNGCPWALGVLLCSLLPARAF